MIVDVTTHAILFPLNVWGNLLTFTAYKLHMKTLIAKRRESIFTVLCKTHFSNVALVMLYKIITALKSYIFPTSMIPKMSLMAKV